VRPKFFLFGTLKRPKEKGCLTAIVGSNSFVVTHLKGVQDGRYVHVADAGTAAETKENSAVSLEWGEMVLLHFYSIPEDPTTISLPGRFNILTLRLC